jgi:transcriptional regulator with XRE-family HTH domain
MAEPTTVGTWLRRERERRGVTLAKISEDTKVAVPLLVGLEADDLSRWPGGIFRRAFLRSYATAIGVDADHVLKRVDEEHPTPEQVEATSGLRAPTAAAVVAAPSRPSPAAQAVADTAFRLRAASLDLLVAGSIGLGCAAAGSRLLWPVIAIAAYHALGVLLTGTTPMAALLSHPAAEAAPAPAAHPHHPPRRAEPDARLRRPPRGRRTVRSEQPQPQH